MVKGTSEYVSQLTKLFQTAHGMPLRLAHLVMPARERLISHSVKAYNHL